MRWNRESLDKADIPEIAKREKMAHVDMERRGKGGGGC